MKRIIFFRAACFPLFNKNPGEFNENRQEFNEKRQAFSISIFSEIIINLGS